jgi:glycosyltransferase involved in cell wall biosynthesis
MISSVDVTFGPPAPSSAHRATAVTARHDDKRRSHPTAPSAADLIDLPLVSIVVPTYNHGRYLAEALESILAQDYARLEIIVIDDGSTDDTVAVLRRFDGRITRESQPNQGQSAALNRGWALSRGAVLSYLSADDVLRPGAVRAAVAVMQAHDDAAFVYGDFEIVDAESRVVRTVRTVERSVPDMVARLMPVSGPGAFFRRTAFERAGRWDSRFRQNPDVDFLLRLSLTGPFVHTPHVMAAYRLHAGSQTSQVPSRARAEEPILIVRGFFGRPDLPDAVKARQRATESMAHALCARQHLRAHRWRAFAAHAAAAARRHLRTATNPRTLKLWAGAVRPQRFGDS